MDNNNFSADSATKSAPRPGVLAALEKTAAIQLSNRFVWLFVGITILAVIQLTLFQINFERFKTMDLMSHIGLFIELGIAGCVFCMTLATPVTQKRWQAVVANRQFSHILNGIALSLNAALLLIIMLVPVLYFHRYQELAEHGLRVPLMMLQRETLVLLAVLISANIILILRHQLRFPWWLAGIIGLCSHVGIGYGITLLSRINENYIRLNDVFYYNQLSLRLEWMPDLLTEQVFHNMESAHFSWYLGYGLLIWLVTLVLWIPASLARRTRSSTK